MCIYITLGGPSRICQGTIRLEEFLVEIRVVHCIYVSIVICTMRWYMTSRGSCLWCCGLETRANHDYNRTICFTHLLLLRDAAKCGCATKACSCVGFIWFQDSIITGVRRDNAHICYVLVVKDGSNQTSSGCRGKMLILSFRRAPALRLKQ